MAQRLFPRSDNQTTYTYAVGELEFSQRGVLTLLAFTWPLPLLLAGRKWKTARLAWLQRAEVVHQRRDIVATQSFIVAEFRLLQRQRIRPCAITILAQELLSIRFKRRRRLI